MVSRSTNVLLLVLVVADLVVVVLLVVELMVVIMVAVGAVVVLVLSVGAAGGADAGACGWDIGGGHSCVRGGSGGVSG